jgi:hypothetical protein
MALSWPIMAAHFFGRGACMSRAAGAAAKLPESERKELTLQTKAVNFRSLVLTLRLSKQDDSNKDDIRQSGVATQPLEKRRPQMNVTTYGLEVAKRVFQMYWVDAQTGEVAIAGSDGSSTGPCPSLPHTTMYCWTGYPGPSATSIQPRRNCGRIFLPYRAHGLRALSTRQRRPRLLHA